MGKKEKKEGGKKGVGIGDRRLFSKPNWLFQLACVVLSNIFRTMTSPSGFKINAGALN